MSLLEVVLVYLVVAVLLMGACNVAGITSSAYWAVPFGSLGVVAAWGAWRAR